MSTRLTTAKLIEMVRPFVDAKANPYTGKTVAQIAAMGPVGHKPQARAIDILHGCNSINVDVRAVTADGFERVWGGFAEFVRWSEVQRVTIRSLDADGRTTTETVYEHDRLPEIAKGQRAFARQKVAA